MRHAPREKGQAQKGQVWVVQMSARVGEGGDPQGRRGGEAVGVVVEKKVRLGLGAMGVPSSSKGVRGGVLGWELPL